MQWVRCVCSGLHVSLVFREGAVRALYDADDNPEQPEGAAEDFDYKDLDK